MNSARFTVVVVSFLLLAVRFVGAAPDRIPEFHVRHIDSSGGLSHNSVYSILQDQDGFLWIGTMDGLNRYDGYEFVTYRHDPDDPQSLSHNFIGTLLEDRSGNLWVGTPRGLNRLDRQNNTFTRYTLESEGVGDEGRYVLCLHEDSGGLLWVGTRHGLRRIDPARGSWEVWQPDPSDPGSLAHNHVVRVREDPAGRIWVLTGEPSINQITLSLWDPGKGGFKHVTTTGEWPMLQDMFIDRSGGFWLDERGPVSFNEETGAFPPPLSAEVHVQEFHQGRNGVIWIGSEDGIFRFDPAVGEVAPLATARSSDAWLANIVQAVYEDRSGTLWIGTHTGLYQYDPHAKPFTLLRHDPTDPNSLSSDLVSSIAEDPSGSLWVGTFGGGLNLVDRASGKVVRFRHDPAARDGLINDIIWSLHGDQRGRLWIGTEDGLCRCEDSSGRFTRHQLREPVSGTPNRIEDIAEDSTGAIWIAGLMGLQRYDPGTGDVQRFPETGDERGPRAAVWGALLVGSDGHLWIGGFTLEKLDLERNLFESFPFNTPVGADLTGEEFYDIQQDRSGRVWAGTYAGLHRFDPRTECFRNYGTQDGLPGSVVYSLVEDDQHRLWLGTNQGLSCYDPRLPEGRQFRNFTVADGIGSTEFNRGAVCRGSSGEIFFGGMNGLTSFFPDQINDNPYIPPLALTRIRSFSREGVNTIQPAGIERLVLSHREATFSFEFSALSFTDSERNRYSHFLEGFDEAWVEAGHRRHARYTNVPPGNYVFRVKGSNNDGLWNEEGLSLMLTITPPFWQTWWFRTLALLLVATALWAAHRFRLEQKLKVERMRLRIAGDLHDDLGSNLSGIALISELEREEAEPGSPSHQRLSVITSTTQQMVGDLRDIVWFVDPGHDKLLDLRQKMKSVAETMLDGVDYSFRAEGMALQESVSPDFRRNIFLIYKEILHNIVRHARAGRVEIELCGKQPDLVLSVTDDGIGFNKEQVEQGHGLNSLRRRAKELGGTLEITSSRGQGTRIVLTAAME